METTSVGAKRFHCAKVLQTEVLAVPDGWLMGIPVEESPFAVQGTAALRQCKSVLFVLL